MPVSSPYLARASSNFHWYANLRTNEKQKVKERSTAKRAARELPVLDQRASGFFEGQVHASAMSCLPFHPSYLSELMLPSLKMEYSHCTHRISKLKGICKLSSCGRDRTWPTFPTFPTFHATLPTTFHTFIMHSSVIFSSLGHPTPLCRSDVPSHPSWNSRK